MKLYDYRDEDGNKKVTLCVRNFPTKDGRGIGLTIGMSYWDEKEKRLFPLLTVTVKPDMGNAYGAIAYVNTDAGEELETFLTENGIAVKETDAQACEYAKSGCCTYPLYHFNLDKLREIAKENGSETSLEKLSEVEESEKQRLYRLELTDNYYLVCFGRRSGKIRITMQCLGYAQLELWALQNVKPSEDVAIFNTGTGVIKFYITGKKDFPEVDKDPGLNIEELCPGLLEQLNQSAE